MVTNPSRPHAQHLQAGGWAGRDTCITSYIDPQATISTRFALHKPARPIEPVTFFPGVAAEWRCTCCCVTCSEHSYYRSQGASLQINQGALHTRAYHLAVDRLSLGQTMTENVLSNHTLSSDDPLGIHSSCCGGSHISALLGAQVCGTMQASCRMCDQSIILLLANGTSMM